MKVPTILIGLLAAGGLSNPLEVNGGPIAVRGEGREHPYDLGIVSSLANPDAAPEDLDSSYGKVEGTGTSPNEERGLGKRYSCPKGKGRGVGNDYDYGCDGGWCWRNCDVNVGSPGGLGGEKKPWCWLAYDGGKGGWTPCGRWEDCKWSYDNKNAKCAKGDCKACGCGC